ncbi:MAG: DUF1361 domain-containing protein [Flavobacteriaceae bacterium]
MQDRTLKNSLALLCLYAISLVVFRVFYTQSDFYLFLIWNLFLAIIPFGITSFLTQVKSKLLNYLLFPIWLVFLPNAPYIITDLFHLQQGTSMPIWFDLLLILSFSISGMLLFFMSLNYMFVLIKNQLSKKTAWFISISILFLSAFGIYLGRYLRWNSWDLIHQPSVLFNDVLMRIIHPTQHPKTWGITLGFGFLFCIGFIIFRVFTVNQFISKK